MSDEKVDEAKALAILLKRDKRFTAATYGFVNDVLSCAEILKLGQKAPTETLDGDVIEDSNDRHITGQDLCGLVVLYAVQNYGLMARAVLERLGIYTTSDLGDVVYNMIGVGLMSKTPTDSREDFDLAFDLGEELETAFEFSYQGKQRKNGRR